MDFNTFVSQSEKIEHQYEVTPEVYHSFQRMAMDYNPLHTDKAFAQQKGFSDCVMYGNILNGFISHFVGMLLPSRDVMIMAQDIKYRKPVYLNDTITLLTEIEETNDGVRFVKYKLKFYRVYSEKKELVASGHVEIKVF